MTGVAQATPIRISYLKGSRQLVENPDSLQEVIVVGNTGLVLAPNIMSLCWKLFRTHPGRLSYPHIYVKLDSYVICC